MNKNSTKAEALSRKDIRKTVDTLRSFLEINIEQSVKIVQLFESFLPVIGFDYEIVEDKELKNNYAETDLNRDIIRVRESVYNGATEGNYRDRFTIAHEIGHAILHKNRTFLCRENENLKPYEDPEWQANTFAGELLVPNNMILNKSIQEISETYKVSREVAAIQKEKSLT